LSAGKRTSKSNSPREKRDGRLGMNAEGGSSENMIRVRRPTRKRRSGSVGKEALFSVSGVDYSHGMSAEEQAKASAPERARSPLFSFPPGPLSGVTVFCSACGAKSPLSWPEFFVARLPLSIWVPFREFDHLMRCPACRRLAWVKVGFFGRLG
jgi:hypothetical protein